MKVLKVTCLVFLLLASQTSYTQQRSSSIRSLDFANFTYPWTVDLIDPANPQKSFTLKKGKLPETRTAEGLIDDMGVYLEEVSYGDVTGDDMEEAIVSMSILTGGSAIPGLVYIYALRNGRPKLLWCFSTGDRADGGLMAVYADHGQLVVELNSSTGKRGDCCPTRFVRTRYEWRGSRFRKKRRELLPIPPP